MPPKTKPAPKHVAALTHTDATRTNIPTAEAGDVLIYEDDDGRVRLEVRLRDETLWLTQADMARLFQCSADNISRRLKNIFDEGELRQEATTEESSVVRQEGGRLLIGIEDGEDHPAAGQIVPDDCLSVTENAESEKK